MTTKKENTERKGSTDHVLGEEGAKEEGEFSSNLETGIRYAFDCVFIGSTARGWRDRIGPESTEYKRALQRFS